MFWFTLLDFFHNMSNTCTLRKYKSSINYKSILTKANHFYTLLTILPRFPFIIAPFFITALPNGNWYLNEKVSLLLLRATLIIHYLVQNTHFRRKKQRVREMTWIALRAEQHQSWKENPMSGLRLQWSLRDNTLHSNVAYLCSNPNISINILSFFFCIFNFYLYLLTPA